SPPPPPPPPPPPHTDAVVRSTDAPLTADGDVASIVSARPCPAPSVDWFSHVWNQLTKVDLGAHFDALLDAWARIEAACRFENPKGVSLPSPSRPEHVHRWIRAARGRRKANLVIEKVAAYRSEWWEWWGSLQPQWRSKETDGSWVIGGEYGKDWDSLSYWGENGVLSVVAALYFWGCCVQDNDHDLEQWECAVNDASWVFEGLASFHESFKGRWKTR
ncbi:hypothetical protein C8R47DRAFT_994709, partial [Mycena vitilis]